MSESKKGKPKVVSKKVQKAQKNKNMIVKKPKIISDDARIRKKPQYKSFRLHKRVKYPGPSLPSWLKISRKSIKLMRANKKNIFKFFIIYGLLYMVFVRGFSSPINVGDIKDAFKQFADADVSTLAANFTIAGLLLQSTTKASGDISGLYQMFLLITSSLALIWLYRQQQAGNKVTMKEAFYRGMYPMIPFILIVVVIALQVIPASIGNFLFRTVIDNFIAVTFLEQFVWFLLFISLLLLSTYMISSSLIALMVVTLPEMTPKIALQKAKELVTFRRFSVLRKVLALIILLTVVFISIVFPSIFISAILAQILFYILVILAIPFATAYLFVLYRELL
ncbi:hypothetical protein KC960_02780 [Candidatus Saccharibacteria bacterium]|nr:hypothetical protein [Candidatus Saccharibacteria bacterium]